MNCEIQKLREKLDRTLLIEPLSSENVLALSEELDQFILEYYKQA